MHAVLLTIHIITCFLVILVVLIQSGRNGGLAGFVGGGGGDALFSTSTQQSGVRKATIILAGIFMATSFILTLLSSGKGHRTVMDMPFEPLQQPAAPVAAPATPESVPAVPVVPAPASGAQN
jgi:preprotein translocase subunit SecG